MEESSDSLPGLPSIAKQYHGLTMELPLAGGHAMREIGGELDIIRYLRSRSPWLEPAISVLDRQLRLQLWSGRPWISFRPMFLVGPPGSGKSHLAALLAGQIGCGHSVLDFAGISDSRTIEGTARGYTTSQPCFPAIVMHQHQTANPVLIVEEVDKAGGSKRNGDPLAVLLTMAERSTARTYFDKCLNRLELTQCEAEITRSQTALSRLLDLVAQGIMSSRDPALAEKIATHRSAIASMQERTDLLTGQLKRMASILTDDLVERFSSLIRAKLRDEDPTLRRNYVRLFVDKVIVGNQSAEEANALKVVIQGSRSTLEGAAFAASASKTGKVPIFDREWCGREDSNFHGLSPTTTSTLRVYHSATTAYRRGTVSQSRKKGAPWVGGRP